MKNKLIVIALAVMLAFTFTGCTNKDEAAAQETVDKFLTAVSDGDWEAAQSYCTEDAYNQTGLDELAAIDEKFAKSLGQKKDNLSDDAKQSLDDLTKLLQDKFLVSYEITEASQSATGVVVKADVTYGFDMDELAKVKVSDKESDKITKGYMKKHKDELLKIYKKKGEKKMLAKIISDIMPSYVDKYVEKVGELGECNDVVQFSLEEKGGKYVIVGVSAVGIENKEKE